MTDILGRKLASHGGSFSVDDSLLTFPNLPDVAAFIPFIITQLGIQYSQSVSRIYGLNLSKVFLVSGRAAGVAALQQVIAPQGNLRSFYETYGNVCNGRGNVMNFALRTGCNGQFQSAQRFSAGTCIANQLGFNTGSEDGIVNNSTQITFESLQYLEG
jgi:hypothetical protein